MLDVKKTVTKLIENTEIRTLLWTNPSPTSAFISQTIPLSLDDYDEVEIIYKWTTSSQDTKSVRSEIGGSARAESLLVSGTSNIQFASRDFSVSSVGINVAVANYAYTDYVQWYKYSGGAGNDLIIPLKIYGIKRV